MTDRQDSIPNLETLNACPCCEATDIGTTRIAGISRCARCRAYFQNPRPLLADIISSYNTGATYASWHQDGGRRDNAMRRRVDYFKSLCRGRTLLDVGCGDGRFMTAAAQAGFEVTGTEISHTAAALAKEKGMTVYTGELADIRLPQESLDVITLWHVLEHSLSPHRMLSLCSHLLRPGGILAVATPNALHYLHQLYLPTHNTAFATSQQTGSEIHLAHFTPACLRSLIHNHRFSIVRFGVDRLLREHGFVRSVKNVILDMQAAFGFHLGCAMYFVARKPDAR
jgi:2-polyprenyl-3-methyl-5-hydroxy-6-metoxy-1,4-benzoquinol methylase